ncbi:MAG: KpsF/GutQ family sugar-phosphate isomerase [Desulfovibrionaceae bacterium]|nr:KpsF/GutQ family sugar-phosphate isomerase [Desulfovibrionaceae bacterium]
MYKFYAFDATQALDIGKKTITIEGNALLKLSNSLNDSFSKCIDILLKIQGRVGVTGMGKSGHIARKIAATLASTGTPAYFIHPSEASHGDLGMVTVRDAIVAISNSGNTHELSDILTFAKIHSLPLIAITSDQHSPLAKISDLSLILPSIHEACPLDCAPTTSTTMSLALGDAIAMALMQARGFTPEDFKSFHPGGNLGQKLLKVQDMMHQNNEVPLCDLNDLMSKVIIEISDKMLGCTGITDNGKLIGIITDGDLRRSMCDNLLTKRAKDIMTANPIIIDQNSSLQDAFKIMNNKKITSLFIDLGNNNYGIIHIHDINFSEQNHDH